MLTLQDVLAARERIRGIVGVTPCPLSEPFSELCGARIHFKLENLHRTGSFKERGAANTFALLTPEERKRGVVAASAGSHAQAVAFNAQRLGVQATIVMPETAPLSKVQATRKFGAAIVLCGNNYDDAYAQARRLQEEKGYVFIHAFDDDAIIAGQGTCALEILEQVPDVEVLVASIGGGGWLGGMALAMKSLKPSVRVLGVESSHLPKMRAALDAGGPIVSPNATTLADGIAVKRVAVRVPDRPGMLAGVLATVAAERANVLEVHHNRAFLQGAIGDTEIDLTLETRGPDHIEALIGALKAKGYAVVRR